MMFKPLLTVAALGLLTFSASGCSSNDSKAQASVGTANPVNQIEPKAVIAVDTTAKKQNQEKADLKSEIVSGNLKTLKLASFVDETNNYKCGFKDSNGKIIIDAIYSMCGDFHDNRAYVVKQKGELETSFYVGYIDESGKIAIPINNQVSYSWYADIRDFREERVAIFKDGKWGYMDKNGKVAIPYQFESAEDFNEGLASVSNTKLAYGAIDKQGNKVIDFKYDYLGQFHDGLATVKDDKLNKMGFIDKSGKLVVDFKWDMVLDFSEGLAAVSNGEYGVNAKWGFIDTKGKLVIKPKYDYAFIDLGGDTVEIFGGKFNNGIVDVYNETPNKFTAITIDKKGNELKRKEYAGIMEAVSL